MVRDVSVPGAPLWRAAFVLDDDTGGAAGPVRAIRPARPATWLDYLALIEEAVERRLPVAPALLQGRDHITLRYDWLNHLYAHDANDLVLYGGSRMPAREAAETLRSGTESYLALAAKPRRTPGDRMICRTGPRRTGMTASRCSRTAS